MGLFDRFFGPPTKEKIARLVIDGIRRAGEKKKLVYDSAKSCICSADDPDRKTYVDNVFAEYCSVPPQERDATIKRFVRAWFDAKKKVPEDFTAAGHDLLPSIRSRLYFESALLLFRAEGKTPPEIPYVPLGEDLAIALVYDLPDSMHIINQSTLDGWGVSMYEALEVARENLASRQFQFASLTLTSDACLVRSATSDNYDASRLLMLPLIRQFKIKGDPIAIVANRDTLLITGSDDSVGLIQLVAMAKEALEKPRPMSGLALRLNGDEWEPWMPDSAHPAFQEFRLLQIQSYGRDYAEQKALLEKVHEKTEEGIFVATYNAMKAKSTDAIFSYSVWGKGVVTLLPRTDRIVFVQDGAEPIFASWDRVAAELGDLIKPMDVYPERFRVTEFPTDEQLHEIADEPIDS